MRHALTLYELEGVGLRARIAARIAAQNHVHQQTPEETVSFGTDFSKHPLQSWQMK